MCFKDENAREKRTRNSAKLLNDFPPPLMRQGHTKNLENEQKNIKKS